MSASSAPVLYHGYYLVPDGDRWVAYANQSSEWGWLDRQASASSKEDLKRLLREHLPPGRRKR